MKNKKNADISSSERTDRIEFEGEVLEALPAALFNVVVNGGNVVICTLAGKLRQNKIRILPGDKVRIEVSPYDLSRGRVMWRQS